MKSSYAKMCLNSFSNLSNIIYPILIELRGDGISIHAQIISEAPSFAEGFNKRATVNYLLEVKEYRATNNDW